MYCYAMTNKHNEKQNQPERCYDELVCFDGA
jgi:hypothetical protein